MIKNLIVGLLLLSCIGSADAGYPCYYYKPQAYAQTYKLPPPTAENWRTEFLRVVREINKQKVDQEDWDASNQLLQALVAVPGTAVGVAPLVAQQGSTIYAESYKGQAIGNLLQPYTQQNLEVAWQMADRQTTNAQNLTGKAQDGFLQALREAGAQHKEVARILALKELVKGDPEYQRTISSPGEYNRTTTVTQGSSVTQGSVTAEQAPGRFTLFSVVNQKCKQCHNATNPTADIDLTKFGAFSQAQKEKVWAAIENPDPNKRMPLAVGPDGKNVPGTPLTFAEKIVFQ